MPITENTPCTICHGPTTLIEDWVQLEKDWDPFGTRELCVDKKICHGCAFWVLKIEKHKAHPEEFIIAQGDMYHLRSVEEGRYVDKKTFVGFLGFGGSEWVVVMGGQRILTNNLWANGTIPTRFRGQLPDNCKLYSRFKDWDGSWKEVETTPRPQE